MSGFWVLVVVECWVNVFVVGILMFWEWVIEVFLIGDYMNDVVVVEVVDWL